LKLDARACFRSSPERKLDLKNSKAQDCGRSGFKGHLQLSLVLDRV